MVKHFYETLYILSPDLSENEREQVNQKYKDFLEKNNVEILKFDPWPLQRLSYRINKKSQGYYVLLEHISPPDLIKELSREMRLDERVLRHINIKKAERLDISEKRAAIK
jgi:small subunit ribosomal protein S6